MNERCPDCGSANYWHEWTNYHKIIRTICCGKLFRVLPDNSLEAVPSEAKPPPAQP